MSNIYEFPYVRNQKCYLDLGKSNDLVKRANQDQQSQDLGNLPSELNSYLHSPIDPMTVGPIKKWTQMAATQPNLTKVALKYLSVVGTSVPSERLFSEAGMMMTTKRNCLEGDLLSKQLFLQSAERKYW